MIENRKLKVVAVLYVNGQEYNLLDIKPQLHYPLPLTLREHVLVFYGIVEGFAGHIIVGRGGFHIIPLSSSVTMSVNFIIDDEEDEQEKFSLLTPVSDSVE